jgi:hypothetical protein
MDDIKKRTSVIWSNLSRKKDGYTLSEIPIRDPRAHSANEPRSNSKKEKNDGVDLPISTQALLLDDDSVQSYRGANPAFNKTFSMSLPSIKGNVISS